MEQEQARIGENIRRYRRMRGLTQEQLADALGLSTFFIGSIERGQASASLRTLVDTANVLDTSTADLIGRDVAQRDGATLRARLGELLRDVPDADLPALTTVLERFASRRW